MGRGYSFWQNTEISIDIPYIEISDEEVSEIDDELNTQPSMSDEFSTNSGKFVFIFYYNDIFFSFYFSNFFFLSSFYMFYTLYIYIYDKVLLGRRLKYCFSHHLASSLI